MRELIGELGIRARTDRRGTVTVFVAVYLLIIIGLAAVGIDGGFWYLQRVQEQNAADFAALAGVAQVAANGSNGSSGGITGAGTLIAGVNGYQNQGSTAVAINSPPQGGAYAGNGNAVEAVIHRKAPMVFTRLIRAFAGLNTPTVAARAVALYSATNDTACVLSLHGSLSASAHSSITGTNCVLASNDTASDGIYLNGSNSTNVYGLSSSGGCSGCSSATLSEPAKIDQLPVPDPFKAAQSYTFPAADMASYSYSKSSSTLQPGYYPGGIKTSGSPTLDFSPGTYVIGNEFQIDGGTLNCSACTFVFLDGTTIKINAQATLNLSAQANVTNYPALDGILFYGRETSTGNGNGNGAVTINGGASASFNGAFYFPTAKIGVAGNEDSGGQPLSQCFIIVANSLTFLGTSGTGLATPGCDNLNVPTMYTYFARLVE